MPIPKFDETMLPILEVLKNGEVVKTSELAGKLLEKKFFTLSSDELEEITASGGNLYRNRVGWGKSYLRQGNFVSHPSRGLLVITDKGKKLLASNPKQFLLQDLAKDPEFQTYRKSPANFSRNKEQQKVEDLSPQDLVDKGYQELLSSAKSELLSKLHNINPYYFQQILLVLFKKMGYGDFIETPKSGDGGIDGIIKQDQLGIERIYIQAKRYGAENKIREPEIRNFIGAMSGDVSRGIFVTTSIFDDSAIRKAKEARNHKIILINGEELAELMLKYQIGIQIKATYLIPEIDEDFFEQS